MIQDIVNLSENGAMGVIFALIIYNFWQTRSYNKTINNHLQHTREALANLTVSLDNNTRVIKDNNRILERIENVLDKK